MPNSIKVGMLVFPSITALDFVGPAEVFSRVSDIDLHFVWKTLDPIPTGCGWSMLPTTTFADAPQFDIICVPGGSGQVALMDDRATLDFLKAQATGARYVTSVCTGSLLLGAAGLLIGYRAACHWMSRAQLALLGALPIAERVVTDRNRITGGGVTAGIDFALALVGQLWGDEVAKTIQLEMEYDPHPPFSTGSPEQAGAELVDRVTHAAVKRQALRLKATKDAAARLGIG